MNIDEYTHYQEEETLALYRSVGWTAYTDHPDTLRNGFEHSLLTLVARENNRLIGLIRTVGDGHTIVLIQDLLVHPFHQRKGVGSALMKAVLARYAHVRQIELATDDTPGTKAFYQSMGFADMSALGCCGMMKT